MKIGLTSLIKVAIISIMFCVSVLLIAPRLFSREPAKPETNRGEFPFKLVYETDGELITVEDTLVIEYLGVGWNEGLGKYNKWNAYYQNSDCDNGNATSIDLIDGFVEGEGSVRIWYALGSCEYYMGLEEKEPIYMHYNISPGDIVISSRNGTKNIANEDLYSRYNIRIIEKSISPPLGLG